VVLGDVVVDLLGEVKVLVHVAGVRVPWIRADRKALVGLPFENPLAGGRTVILLFDLMDECPGLLLTELRVLAQPRDELFAREKMPGDHRKDETPVMADVPTFVESPEKVAHHFVLSKVFDGHGASSLEEG